MKLTMKQIHFFIDRIITRKHNEHAQVAALHGIEIKLKGIKRQVEEFSLDQKAKFTDAIKVAIKRNMSEKLGV